MCVYFQQNKKRRKKLRSGKWRKRKATGECQALTRNLWLSFSCVPSIKYKKQG